MIRVVCGVKEGRFRGEYFVAKRKHKEYNNCWEFPGGKVEEGESDVDALVREWKEEFGATITVGSQIGPGLYLTDKLHEVPFVLFPYRVLSVDRMDLRVHSEARMMSWHAILGLSPEESTPSLPFIARWLGSM